MMESPSGENDKHMIHIFGKMFQKAIPSLLLLGAFSIAFPALAQEENEPLIRGSEVRSDLSWHPDDQLFGLGGGVRVLDHYRTGLKCFFRPYYAPRVYESKRGMVQYQEKRWGILFYAERSFTPAFLAPIHLNIGASGGWARETRKGFPEEALDHFLIVPRASLGWRFKEQLEVQIEYRFAPQPSLNAKEHRIALRTMIDL